MKIMHVTWGLSPGGTENLLVDVANKQVKTASVTALIINNAVADSLLDKLEKTITTHLLFSKNNAKLVFPTSYTLAASLYYCPPYPNNLIESTARSLSDLQHGKHILQ